jgi:hypothetical protein
MFRLQLAKITALSTGLNVLYPTLNGPAVTVLQFHGYGA